MASEIQRYSDEYEPGEDLRPSQIRAITALMESPSIVAAAEKAELNERTIRRWLRDDERFQAALRHIRTEALSQAERARETLENRWRHRRHSPHRERGPTGPC